jgi:hypothetical protein
MNDGDAREHDARVRALQRDADAVVPDHVECDLLSAFRAHHAVVLLRHDEDVSVLPRLEARLLTAFREHHGQESGPARALRGFTWYASRAAVLIAAVAGATWFALPHASNRADAPHGERTQITPKPAVVAEAERPRKRHIAETRSAATVPGVAAPAAPRPIPERAVFAANREAPAPTPRLDEDQSGGEFMPLLNGDLSASEPTHIVSVDVPRSALLDFGAQAEVTADGAAAVRAEVLMSEDGMPRGVRFVDRAPAPLGRPSASERAHLPMQRRLQP